MAAIHSSLIIATDASCLKDNAKDGAGHTACAFVVIENNVVIKKSSTYLGKRTISEAEYYGIIRAIEYANKNYKDVNIQLYSDSEFAVKQINGQYKVKAENIYPLYHRVMEILPDNIKVFHHRRESILASFADSMAGAECQIAKMKAENNEEQSYALYRKQ